MGCGMWNVGCDGFGEEGSEGKGEGKGKEKRERKEIRDEYYGISTPYWMGN